MSLVSKYRVFLHYNMFIAYYIVRTFKLQKLKNI